MAAEADDVEDVEDEEEEEDFLFGGDNGILWKCLFGIVEFGTKLCLLAALAAPIEVPLNVW